MRCEDIREIISLYIDDELNEEECNEIKKHLQSCEECNREYEDLLTIKKLLSEVPQMELPSNFKEELHKKLVASVSIEDNEENTNNGVIDFKEKSNKVSVNKKKFNWKVLSGVAAVFIAVVSLSFLMENDFRVKDAPEMEMQEELAQDKNMSFKMADEKANYSSELAKEAPLKAKEAEMDSYTLEAPAESAPGITSSEDRANAIRSLDKKVILIEQIIMQTEDYEWTFSSIQNIISSKGGYLQSSNTSDKVANENETDKTLKKGNLVVRISNGEFDNIVSELSNIGTIANEITSSSDVTKEYNEASNELMNLELQEKEISEAIAAGETVYGSEDAEKELTNTREEIVRLKADIDRWDDLVELATIHIDLEEVDIEGTE